MGPEFVHSSNAPAPGGHYVQAIKHDGLIYISGQLSFPPEGPEFVAEEFTAQAKQAFKNIEAILEQAGLDFSHLLQLRAYIVGIENWPLFNTVCAEFMQQSKSARAVVPVPSLHYGCLVELEAIAFIPS